MVKKGILIAFLLLGMNAIAQDHFVVRTTLNKSSAYIGEPVQLSIDVFTSTWFTTGVDPGNINIDGAYTIYFGSMAFSEIINGKSYAGVKLTYNIFPYENHPIEIPVLEFEVESPVEGDYKGVTSKVKTSRRRFLVKPIPKDFLAEDWLVADAVRVYDNWQGDFANVKVGDVLTRRIKKEAYGTIGQFIWPSSFDSIPNVSLYPLRSQVTNNKTKTAISATRTDGTRYLFEKEGEVVIPEQVITWWNPSRKRLYKKTLKSRVIQVKPNPDLGMLASVKSQLAQQVKEENKEAQAKEILGMSYKKFAIVSVILIVVLIILIRIVRKLITHQRARKIKYKGSEAYLFDQFMGSKTDYSNLYHWFDYIGIQPPTMHAFAQQYGTEDLKKEVLSLESQLAIGKAPKSNKKLWKKARRRYLKSLQPPSKQLRGTYKINP
ncbi:MAG: hypothetical protein ACPGRE_01175 [Flavobacteriaceae bacterium]